MAMRRIFLSIPLAKVERGVAVTRRQFSNGRRDDDTKTGPSEAFGTTARKASTLLAAMASAAAVATASEAGKSEKCTAITPSEGCDVASTRARSSRTKALPSAGSSSACSASERRRRLTATITTPVNFPKVTTRFDSTMAGSKPFGSTLVTVQTGSPVSLPKRYQGRRVPHRRSPP